MLRFRARNAVSTALFVAGLTAAALPLEAHPAADPDPPLVPTAAFRASAGPDFLFGAPHGSLSFRVGRLFARTDGQVFDDTFENLTVGPRDLDAIALGADLALRFIERLDVVIGVGFSRTSVDSEFRDWVDQDDQPILQTTRLQQVPLTVGARLYVTPRGRSISRFAWVPARTSLYVTGGLGAVNYAYEQEGDFVDYETLDIFPDDLHSSGWAALAYLGGGAELRVTTRAALVADVRYTYSNGTLAGDFSEYTRIGAGDIGLGGLATSVGLALTF